MCSRDQLSVIRRTERYFVFQDLFLISYHLESNVKVASPLKKMSKLSTARSFSCIGTWTLVLRSCQTLDPSGSGKITAFLILSQIEAHIPEF